MIQCLKNPRLWAGFQKILVLAESILPPTSVSLPFPTVEEVISMASRSWPNADKLLYWDPQLLSSWEKQLQSTKKAAVRVPGMPFSVRCCSRDAALQTFPLDPSNLDAEKKKKTV